MSSSNALESRLGLFSTTLAGVGVIIGAGIFVLIGVVAGHAGSNLWLSFILAAFAAVLTGFSYAELSSIMTKDEGEGEYAERAFGSFTGFFSAILMNLVKLFSATTVAIGFAGYFISLFNIGSLLSVSIIVLVFLSFFAWHGTKDTFVLNNFFTILSIVALLFISVVPFFKNFAPIAWTMPNGFLGVFHGASIAFFAYLGFGGIIRLSEETKNPSKTIPRAILLSIAISTMLYLAVAFSALKVLGWKALSTSAAPLADVASAVLGSHAFTFIAFVALFATANTVLLSIVYASRGFYGLGEEFKKFKWFLKVGSRKTPTRAILVSLLFSLGLLFLGGIDFLAELTTFFVLVAFIIVNISLIVLRYKESKTKRPFKVSLSIGKFPILPALSSLILVFLFVNLSSKSLLIGFIFSVVVASLYYFVREESQLEKFQLRKSWLQRKRPFLNTRRFLRRRK